jgi:hypothetical protein
MQSYFCNLSGDHENYSVKKKHFYTCQYSDDALARLKHVGYMTSNSKELV